jgi:MoxR-like ATPase
VPDPFIVMATQNPIESEGVYPLPEAQRDRFLMKILVDYPTAREEVEIVRRMSVAPPVAQTVLEPDELLALQRAADAVFIHDAIVDYAVRLVLATRAPAEHGLADLAGLISHGASPRATLGLVAASRGLALLRGREFVLPQDVYDVAPDVLRHRVLLSYEAIADGVTAEQIVNRIAGTVLAPRLAPSQDNVLVEERAS